MSLFITLADGHRGTNLWGSRLLTALTLNALAGRVAAAGAPGRSRRQPPRRINRRGNPIHQLRHADRSELPACRP